MQNKTPSPSLPSNSMKVTSNTIIESKNSNYSRTFGDNIISKTNLMTRVLYQNTESLGISIDLYNFEVICGFMYDN